jgi:hypothetical protein
VSAGDPFEGLVAEALRRSRGWDKITSYGLYPAARGAGAADPCDVPDEGQISKCQEWLRLHAERTKTVRRRRSSYAYKHHVECWTRTPGTRFKQLDPWGRKWTSEYFYVSNGAFIEAARREGYRVVQTDSGSPNAYFDFQVPRSGRRGT